MSRVPVASRMPIAANVSWGIPTSAGSESLVPEENVLDLVSTLTIRQVPKLYMSITNLFEAWLYMGAMLPNVN